MTPVHPESAIDATHDTQAQSALRLLLVVPFGPRYDNLHGGRVTAQLLRHLIVRHRVAIVYLRRAGHPKMDPDLADGCDLVEEVQLGTPRIGQAWQHRVNVLAAPILGRPSSVSAAFSSNFVRAVRQVAMEWRPDIIQIEHDALAYCAPSLRDSGGARILVSHDPGLRSAAHLAAVTAGRQRLAHRLDASIWKRYWRATLGQLDAAVVFSDDDAAAIRSVVPQLFVTTIPLGIDMPKEPLSPVGSQALIALVGGYTHQPNADAAIRLLTSIMPLVRARRAGAQLVLVGDRPTKAMLEAATDLDEITGRVERVDPYVDRAAVIALPIRIGGGMRVKLLEAMAAGKAIVASPLAAAGLPLTDRSELVIAETDQEFADAIVALLNDPERREQLGNAARSWAQRNLRWESRVLEYEELYRSLISSRPDPA